MAEAHLTDAQLISACLHGEAPAWDTLVERYVQLIYAVPLALGLSQEQAARATQATFAALYEELPALGEETSLAARLIVLTQAQCSRLALQPQATTSRVDAPAPAPLSPEGVTTLERQHLLRLGIGQLPERCRALLALYWGQNGPDPAEVERRLHIPQRSVPAMRARCLRTLRSVLDRLGFFAGP